MVIQYRIVTFFLILALSLATGCATGQHRKAEAEALRNLAEAYMTEKKYTEALGELLNAEKIYKNDPFLYNDLGLVYMAKGKIDLSIASFERAVDLKPDYSAARNNLGSAYVARQDWDKAIVCFTQVLEDLLYMTPHYPLANLGWAYYHKKDYPNAAKYHLEALKMVPDFVLSLRGLALTYQAQERFAEALVELEKAVAKAPHMLELYLDIARTQILQNNKLEALHAYEKVLQLAPEGKLADWVRQEIQKLDYR